ncbi:MAG: hypothetical protein CVV27_03990 [Candidatus Melainabacteria bacterium HGW-Melainabacteria-1]|nr:MAG: hypothetical protein CVV27_03990 [Candidatus Melainabacteria bacterium HGW-Melainabacteria-1]
MHLIWDQIHNFAPDIDRESDYGQACFQGLEALGRAQEEEGMLAYRQASEAFLNALEASPLRPEALLGISYLLVLLGDEFSAVHYLKAVLELAPNAREAKELFDLLDSSHRLNSLLEDVERLCHSAGIQNPSETEFLSEIESHRLVDQTELLLQLQHNLLVHELNQGQFSRLDQLNSRQRSLETLYDALSAHLTHFLADRNFGTRLQARLDILAFDLESLQNLENLFDAMRVLQKEVQALFRELTRQIIQLRMKKSLALDQCQNYHRQLQDEIAKLEVRLEAFPVSLRRQVESASGWSHLHQQSRQLEELIQSTQASAV